MGTDNLKGLVESFGQLYSMQNEDKDIKAAELYRAMFRHEKNKIFADGMISETGLQLCRPYTWVCFRRFRKGH